MSMVTAEALPSATAFPAWLARVADLTRESWDRLIDNRLRLIRIPGFASDTECEALVREAEQIGFELYREVSPPIARIGVTLFEHDGIGHEDYFVSAQKAREIQRRIFARSFDPIERLISMIQSRTGYPTGVALDSQHGPYFAGTVRRIESGTRLHIDYAPAEHPSWEVAQVCAQLAWNVYLELPESGGNTHIYERQWVPADDGHKETDSYGYDSAVVAGSECVTFKPTQGDLYLFNSRNYHLVDASVGHRTTVNSAVGQTRDNKVVLWS
ncbi:MAG: hypothetical protein MPN21_11940 [Thermoanaerobaculia bacterium]|nr:hypothetical protein [Thermoanaerobaculia bacterium]